MSDFIEVSAGKISLSLRRPVFGVGINDADYITQRKINEKVVTCPYYKRWQGMLKRCYSDDLLLLRPTYKGCTVCEEWLTFSNFKEWMKKQKWEGMELDKDIINPGNKFYSPESCRFVTQALNSLLTDGTASRGLYPQGVCYHKKNRKYRAKVSINGKDKHIGNYSTPEAAGVAYIQYKAKIILQASTEQSDPLIAKGLRMHAKLLVNR